MASRSWLVLAAAAATCAIASPARAESVIKNPGDHPDYHVELEPHGIFGWEHLYAGTGFGLGGRVSIPIVDNGFVKTINNSVAISFGVDWLRYSGCYYNVYRGRASYNYGCGASYFLFPVTMQWNFWLTTHWSVFGEPGFYIYHGIYDNYCDPTLGPACTYPTATGIDFAFFAGGRYHFTDKVSLTMRIGWPYISVGVSFLL